VPIATDAHVFIPKAALVGCNPVARRICPKAATLRKAIAAVVEDPRRIKRA